MASAFRGVLPSVLRTSALVMVPLVTARRSDAHAADAERHVVWGRQSLKALPRASGVSGIGFPARRVLVGAGVAGRSGGALAQGVPPSPRGGSGSALSGAVTVSVFDSTNLGRTDGDSLHPLSSTVYRVSSGGGGGLWDGWCV